MDLRRLSSFLRRRPRLRLFWLTDDLVFGPAPSDEQWSEVSRAGLRAAVDLRAEVECDGACASANGLDYFRLPVSEGSVPSDQELLSVSQWIADSVTGRGPVLIFCREGLGRSPLVACAALVRMGLPLSEAYRALRRARPNIALSDGQAKALERVAALLGPGAGAA